jgi:hypothetical protein
MSEAPLMAIPQSISMEEVLHQEGWRPAGTTGEGLPMFSKGGFGVVVIDDTGWEHLDEEGNSLDFGSDARDLRQRLTGEKPSLHSITQNELETMRVPESQRINEKSPVSKSELRNMPVHTKTMSSKLLHKSYTMTNEGYGTNSKCYKCQQPIEEGQMATWEGGMECHAGGCPRAKQQPQLTPSQRIQNMPQRGNPKTPAQLGLTPRAVASKKAYGLTNQGQQDAVCPNCNQPIGEGEMVNYTQSGMEAHVQCPPATGQQPAQAPGWQSRLNLPAGYKPPQAQPAQPAPAKQQGMISPNVGRPRASLIARINNLDRKTALFGEGAHHHFSLEVPMKAGGTVAFHLAKAGLEDFEANNYREEGTTEFAFKSEPEMHIAEEIIRAEFAREIEGKHGGWGSWAPKAEDPSMVKAPNEVEKQHLMSSEKTADAGYEQALQQALTALEALAKSGPSEDIRGCAQMSAADLKQFADDFKEGRARHFSSESDMQCCCVLGHLAFKKKW